MKPEKLPEFIEDVRKLWSNTPKPMSTTKTNGRGTPMGYINKIEAASIMGCTVRSIDNWMKLKLIPHYKFGRAVLFKESDLLEAIEKTKVS